MSHAHTHTCTSLAEFPSTFWSEVWRCYNPTKLIATWKQCLLAVGENPLIEYTYCKYTVQCHIWYAVSLHPHVSGLWRSTLSTYEKNSRFARLAQLFVFLGGRCGVCRWGPELMQTWWQVPIVDHRTAAWKLSSGAHERAKCLCVCRNKRKPLLSRQSLDQLCLKESIIFVGSSWW